MTLDNVTIVVSLCSAVFQLSRMEIMKISDYLSQEEKSAFRQLSNSVGFLQVVSNYAIIIGAFALFGFWPNPLTFVVSAALLAGRYVGLGILNHDAAHNALFRTKRLNRRIARWLFSGPTLIGYDTYRAGHLSHHRYAGTIKDPDIPFVRSYPVQRDSMRRKLTRDFIGRTGLRDTLYLCMMTVKHFRWRAVVVHLVMFGALYSAGIPWAYPMWWVGLVFFVPAFLRIRVMGEHGNVVNLLSKDAREHARTTHAGWLARMFISPNYVNYHCEHHFFATVPGHRLPALHKLLKERGFYDDNPTALAPNYISVIRECVGSRDDRPDLSEIEHGKASLANMV